MNRFSEQFSSKIEHFWASDSEEIKQRILLDVLQYAKINATQFRKEIAELRFAESNLLLSVVIEALHKDAEYWGDFFVETLEAILQEAEKADRPEHFLTHLFEFAYLEDQQLPFVDTIVERLAIALDSGKLKVKLAAVATIIPFLKNPVVTRKSVILDKLEHMLNDEHWKVRYVTYRYLSFENLLPSGFKLSLSDRLRRLILGEPYAYQ